MAAHSESADFLHRRTVGRAGSIDQHEVGPVAGQCERDGAPDPLAPAGHQRELTFVTTAHEPTPAAAASTCAAVPIDSTATFLSSARTRPASTLPGPISTKRSAPHSRN